MTHRRNRMHECYEPMERNERYGWAYTGCRRFIWNALYDERFPDYYNTHWTSKEWPNIGLKEGKRPVLIHGERVSNEVASLLSDKITVFNEYIETPLEIPADLSRITEFVNYYPPIISAAFMELIEELEPGVHQFFSGSVC